METEVSQEEIKGRVEVSVDTAKVTVQFEGCFQLMEYSSVIS